MSAKVASIYVELGVEDNLTPELKKSEAALRAEALGLGDLRDKMIQLESDADGLADSQKNVADESNVVTDGLQKQIATTLSYLGALALTKKGIDFAVESWKAEVDAAAQAQTTLAGLTATIQSTGRSGEVSSGQVAALADQMQGLFTKTDIESAANILMRYMDIPTEKIPEDLTLLQNMAVRYGSMTEAADVLGRMLETGQLRGQGFSREMQNMISVLMSAGKIEQADAIIMDQLNQKYSGQAAAALDTYAGSQAKVKTATQDLNELVGGLWIPTLTTANNVVSEAIGYYERWAKVLYGGESIMTLFKNFPIAVDASKDSIDGFGQAVETAGYGVDSLTSYVIAFNGAVIEGRIQGKALAEASAVADEAAVKAAQELQRQIISRSDWEEMYTGAKTTAEKITDSFDYIGQGIQGIKDQGGLIWEGYLEATGKISPAALEQFVKVEYIIQHVKDMVAAGVDFKITTEWLTGAMGALNPTPAPAQGGTKTLAPWATAEDRAYAATHPETYAPVTADVATNLNTILTDKVGDVNTTALAIKTSYDANSKNIDTSLNNLDILLGALNTTLQNLPRAIRDAVQQGVP